MDNIVTKRAGFISIGDNVLNQGIVKDKTSLSNGFTLIRFDNNTYYTEFPTKSILFINVE